MAQELQTTSEAALPALNLNDPSSLLLLPAWLARSLNAVSSSGNGRILRDETGNRIGEVPTLPASKMLTGRMRREVNRRVAELEDANRSGPPDETATVLASLFTRYPTQRGDEDAAAIRSESYLDAVEDLPAWALREAVRRWRRGQCGVELKLYDFAPSEARLRQLAEGIARVAVGQAIALRRLLSAEQEVEISRDVRRQQAAELGRLSIGLRSGEHEGDGTARELERLEAQDRLAAMRADLEARAAKRLAEAPADQDAGPSANDPVAPTPAFAESGALVGGER